MIDLDRVTLKDRINMTSADVFMMTPPPDHRMQRIVDKLARDADGFDDPKEIPKVELQAALIAVSKNEATSKQLKIACMAGLPTIQAMDQETVGQSLVDRLLSTIEVNGDGLGKKFYKALLVGYLVYGVKGTWLGDLVLEFLKRHVDDLPIRWAERVREHHLLDDDVGKHFLQYLLEWEPNQTKEQLRKAGLAGLRLNGAVGGLIFETFALELGSRLTRDRFERFKGYVTTQEGVRFSNRPDLYAEALLRPFLKGVAEQDLQHEIQDFLIQHFDDPRTRQARWASVDPELLNLIRRWLAEGAFDLLMSVVNASNSTHQWTEREEFWKYYFNKEVITDAWVALGENANFEAKKLINAGQLRGTGEYGRIVGHSVQSDHSMLILRMGDFIVSEWTHEGKVRLYRSTNKYAPQPYLQQYKAQKIREDFHADFAMAHMSNWRAKLSSVLKYHLGIEPPPEHRAESARYNANYSCPSCHRSMHKELKSPYEKVCNSCKGGFER